MKRGRKYHGCGEEYNVGIRTEILWEKKIKILNHGGWEEYQVVGHPKKRNLIVYLMHKMFQII